jgi:hypothetical protein
MIIIKKKVLETIELENNITNKKKKSIDVFFYSYYRYNI